MDKWPSCPTALSGGHQRHRPQPTVLQSSGSRQPQRSCSAGPLRQLSPPRQQPRVAAASFDVPLQQPQQQPGLRRLGHPAPMVNQEHTTFLKEVLRLEGVLLHSMEGMQSQTKSLEACVHGVRHDVSVHRQLIHDMRSELLGLREHSQQQPPRPQQPQQQFHPLSGSVSVPPPSSPVPGLASAGQIPLPQPQAPQAAQAAQAAHAAQVAQAQAANAQAAQAQAQAAQAQATQAAQAQAAQAQAAQAAQAACAKAAQAAHAHAAQAQAAQAQAVQAQAAHSVQAQVAQAASAAVAAVPSLAATPPQPLAAPPPWHKGAGARSGSCSPAPPLTPLMQVAVPMTGQPATPQQRPAPHRQLAVCPSSNGVSPS